MKIIFTRLTDDRHRLTIVRDDGSTESDELESRSLLLHDLAHYAVEAEAKMDDGVWGTRAKGPLPKVGTPSIMRAERLAAPMQSVWNGRLDEQRYAENAGVDLEFVARAKERLRRLVGHWKATPYRADMVIEWPPDQGNGEPIH